MGAGTSRSDYEWVYTEEPHASRRKAILGKYPEIKKLMGPDHRLKYIITLMVITQIVSAYFIRNESWTAIIILAYVFGGTINHSLSLGIHEIAHNIAFGNGIPLANRFFGFFANLPIGVPLSIAFRKYHLEHHRYQGDEVLDQDIPCSLEAKLFTRTFTKFIWVCLQPWFYSLRPILCYPKPVSVLEVLNVVIQLSFDFAIFYFLGIKSLVYLVSGSFMAMSLHPMAGHFISEHYLFVEGYETYSYYGPLNWLTFNVGYHNEHHDFPSIPGSRLDQVRKIAPEFYDNLPHHTSWVKVIWDFIFDPKLGPYSRIRRHTLLKKEEKSAVNGKTSQTD